MEGYRLLRKGEIIRRGDEYRDGEEWKPVLANLGSEVDLDAAESCFIVRRKIDQSTEVQIKHLDGATPTIKDSGKREEFTTGSRRDIRDGKGRFDLLPPRALFRVARHYEGGAKKYGDRNWERGQPLSRYFDSAMRHMASYMRGDRDEDHVTAAAWNLLCLIETEDRINENKLPSELNDIPCE